MSKEELLEYVENNYTTTETGLIIRVACYIRVSTQEQKLHGLSLDAQRDTLKRYAREHGLKIVAWYEDEGVSGRKLIKKRPALQRMLNDAQKGYFDRIIFIKLDRYFRSVAEYYECQKILESHKVLWTATEERYDLTTASGRYWVTQKLAMAEYEADNTGERIKLVNEYKIRTGQPLTGAQSQGLAYTVEKDAEGIKRVVPDPETKDAVMDYINYYLVHQNKRQAHQYIQGKYGKKYSYDSLSKCLSDTKIYGHYRGNDNYCTPYIDKSVFDKLQEILASNVKTSKTKRAYIFSGLIICPCCGRKLSSACLPYRTNKKANGKQYINTKEIYFYRCNWHKKDNVCDFNKNPNEKKIEAYLLEHFDAHMQTHIATVELSDTREQSSHAAETIKNIKSEMTKLNNMYRKSRISEVEYDREYDELDTQLKAAEAELKPIEKRDLTIYKEVLQSGWKGIYESLDRENKRAFWRKYIKEIHLDKSGKVIDLIFF